MSEKINSGPSKSAQEILTSLTPREVEVLRERFGIDFEGCDEEELKQTNSFNPPSGNSGGQGGAPQVAIAPSPSLQDKEHRPPKPQKVPKSH
jgi:hypothetical protein